MDFSPIRCYAGNHPCNRPWPNLGKSVVNRRFRDAYATMLATMRVDAAVTLVYNDPSITEHRMRGDLRTLRAHVDREVLGRRFHSLPVSCRSEFWAVPEKLNIHPHWHLGWRLAGRPDEAIPLDDRIEILNALLNDQGLWKKFAPCGTARVSRCDPGWMKYATKSIQDEIDIVWSAEFN